MTQSLTFLCRAANRRLTVQNHLPQLCFKSLINWVRRLRWSPEIKNKHQILSVKCFSIIEGGLCQKSNHHAAINTELSQHALLSRLYLLTIPESIFYFLPSTQRRNPNRQNCQTIGFYAAAIQWGQLWRLDEEKKPLPDPTPAPKKGENFVKTFKSRQGNSLASTMPADEY